MTLPPMAPDGVPVSPDLIEPAWLTDVLRAAGATTSAVTGFDAVPVGTGQLGDCYRLQLRYDRDDPGAPRSIVGKFPAKDPTSRSYASRVGLYAREVDFYRELAPILPIRTPRPYVAELGATPDRFILLLEDLAPARACDQLTGCGPDDAVVAVDQAAALHAASWRNQDVLDRPFLRRQPGQWMAIADVMPRLHDTFIERYGDVLAPRHHEVARRLRRGISGWLETLDDPTCLWHLDFRLDNMLFDACDGQIPLAVVDWQSVTVGPGMADVSYFIGGGLLPDDRRRHEAELVRRYHDALGERGVTDYPFDTCWADYRRHAVLGFFTAVNASVNVERTARGDEMFLAMARRHGDQILELDTLELIGA